MKLITPKTTISLGNVQAETKMSLDPEAMAHIIGSLTDLYSDRIMAFVREYSTNAWDSHVRAGVTAPISVTLPTRDNLFFTVEDNGLGLSADELANIYSMYGRSLNRDSDDAAGMFGFGCKSALAYGDSFSVIATKDSVRTTVVVVKGDDGVGVLKVIDQRAVDQPNGVKVVVPVRQEDVNEVSRAAAKFYLYWDAGTVLVDGEPPRCFWQDQVSVDENGLFAGNGQWLRLDEDVYAARQNYNTGNEHQIVMGQVAYPVPLTHVNLSTGFQQNWLVVARVPMGSVDFTPSRESLKVNSPITRETLTTLGEYARNRLIHAAREYIEAAASPWDRFQRWHRVTKLGVRLPDALGYRSPSKPWNNVDGWVYNSGQGRSTKITNGLQRLAGQRDEVFVVYNYPFAALTPKAKARIDADKRSNTGWQHSAVVLNGEYDVLVGHPNAVDYNDLPEVKVDRAGRSKRQFLYKWATYNRQRDEIEVYEADEPRGPVVAWVNGKTAPHGLVATPDVHVAMLRLNQVDKFKRLNPTAQGYAEYVIAAREEAAKHVTADDKLFAGILHEYRFHGAPAGWEAIEDPEFRRICEVWHRYTTNPPQNYTRAQNLGVTLSRTPIHGILERYPLVNRWHSGLDADAILYVNTKYQHTTEAQEAKAS